MIPGTDPFSGQASGLDPKVFYRLLELSFGAIRAGASAENALRSFIPAFLDRLGGALQVETVHLYRRNGAGFLRLAEWGTPQLDDSARLNYLADGQGSDGQSEIPWVGGTAEGLVGVVGIDPDHRLVLEVRFGIHAGDVNSEPVLDRLKVIVSSLHYALNQELSMRALCDAIEQARVIQMSLLPDRPPVFGDYDIAAVSIPATSVGGDLYDFRTLDAETLALTIADASGHGLPAALQARDVITGLRMGVERDLKIVRIVEKLGRVIHESGLASRFVSLMFGELELNGTFSYVNAGHPPPLILDAAGFRELTIGGMIVGPRPDAAYKLGFAHLDPGAVMALYTDGVVERMNGDGREFGMERIRAWLQDWPAGPAAGAIEDLVHRLRKYAEGTPFEDDVTAIYIRRPR